MLRIGIIFLTGRTNVSPGPGLGRDARLEQDFRTQVVADAGNEILVQQQSAKATPAKALVIEYPQQILHGYPLVQRI